jgi:non-homologous end joining protein Ku
MPTPRSIKSTLSFGLVSCPVALFRTVGEAEKPPAWATRNELDIEFAVPDHITHVTRRDPLADHPEQSVNTTKDPEPEKPRKGILDAAGAFVDLTEEIDAIADRTKLESMRIASFVRTEEIRRERIIGSYFLAPDGPGATHIVAMLARAMQAEKRVAVVRWTKRSRQALGVLIADPQTGGLKVIELAWAEDCRQAPVRAEIPAAAIMDVSDEEVALARDLVQAMASTRADALDTLVDEARGMIRELRERAEAGEKFSLPALAAEAPGGAEVIELLRSSTSEPALLADVA